MTKTQSLPYRPCVGIMLVNHEGKVWMGRRISFYDKSSSREKRWQMPQGGIDKGEEPLDAAVRELWEETGVAAATFVGQTKGWLKYDLPKDLIGKALKGKWCGQEQKWFAFRFEGDDTDINITNPPDGAPVEFDDWQWVDVNEVSERIVDFKRDIYVEVIKTFRHLAVQ